MKTALATILIGLLGIMAPSVQAATLTWNGATNGTWSAANWSGGTPVDNGTDALIFAGTNNLSTTNNLGNYTASSITFNSDSGAFFLAGNAINLTGAVTNNSALNNQTFSLDLALSSGIHIFTANKTITVNGTISGTGSIRKVTGGTTLFLNSTNNSYTGYTEINGGTVSVLKLSNGNSTSSIGASSNAASNINLPNGTSILTYAGTGDSTDRLFTVGSNVFINGNGTGGAAGALSFTNTGAIAYGSANSLRGLTLGGTNTGDNTMAPVFGNNGSGVFSLIKAGVGNWILTGNNTYTGATTVSGGTLKAGNTSALGFGGIQTTATNGTTVSSGFTLDLNGTTGINEPITINGTGIGANGALVNNSGTAASIANGIAGLAVAATGSGSGYSTAPTVVISGTGTGATATASLGLTTASIVSATGGTGWVTGDTVNVTGGGGSGAIGTVTASGGVITSIAITNAGTGYTSAPTGMTKATSTAGAGTLTLTGNGVNFTVGGLAMTAAGSGYTGTPTFTFNGSGATVTPTLSSVVLAANSSIGGTGDLTTNAVVSESGGARALTKVGSGTLTLTGANTYTGATTITAGTLQFAKQASLYNNTPASWTAANINVKSGATATFNVGGASGEFSATDIDTIKALGGATTGFNSGSFLGLDTTNAAGGSFAYTSNITNTNAGANVVGLKKLGSGTLDLSGSSTYTGATTVSAGTLLVSAGNINSSAVTVAAGALLKYNSGTARTGAITLSGNGSGSRAILSGNGTINVAMTLDNLGDTLSPGNSPGLLTFATSESWNSFTYLWETNNFTGTTAGTNFDQIVITGGLTLGGGLGAYVLDLNSLTAGNLPGNVGSFSDVNRSWTILTTTTGITGFDAANWTISTGNFTSSPTWSGTWSLAKSGNDLVLAYAIPEPSAVALLSIGIFASGLLAIRRSRRA